VALPTSTYLVLNKIEFSPKASAPQGKPEYKGYIVELTRDPVPPTDRGFGRIQAERDLTNDHAKAKEAILKKLGKKGFVGETSQVQSAPPVRGQTVATSLSTSPDTINLLGEYSLALNGFALDISDSQAQQIRSLPGVKRVVPNLIYKTTLMDSVPMIGADKVWQQVKDARGLPVTGQGINVGVIDTGVDSTHPDLGGTQMTERPFTAISGKLALNTSHPKIGLQLVG